MAELQPGIKLSEYHTYTKVCQNPFDSIECMEFADMTVIIAMIYQLMFSGSEKTNLQDQKEKSPNDLTRWV